MNHPLGKNLVLVCRLGRHTPGKMKLHHLPPALFLLVLAFSLLTYHFPSSQQRAGDAVLRRLAAVDAGGDQVLADAAALLANASISSSQLLNNHSLGHRLLRLRLPCSSCRLRQRTVSSLRVPPYGYGTIPDDGALRAAFRASLRSFLRAHQRQCSNNNVAGVMRDLPGLLGRHRRFRTCAVVGNSGILLGSGRGAQIDAHEMVIRLNNAPVAGEFARDVGAKTSLTLAHSFVLRRCSTNPGCSACHPYGRSIPLQMYVSRPEHLLDAVACAATATAASLPFPLRLTDARLDTLSARIAKYYSLRRFVAATGGEPVASGWAWRRPHYFHYSTGLQAVLMAVGACEEVSMFGFGKAAKAKHHYHTDRNNETDVHDYEAEYEFYRDLQTRPEAVPFLDEAPPGFKVPPVKQYW